MDRCRGFCSGGRDADPNLRFRRLCDPHALDGEDVARERLPFCQQIRLWSAYPDDTAVDPLCPQYPAPREPQVICGMDRAALCPLVRESGEKIRCGGLQ